MEMRFNICHNFTFRIHYPLPLPYVGKPDPVQLQETIRKLGEENLGLKEQVTLDLSGVSLGQEQGVLVEYLFLCSLSKAQELQH